jgi:ABC-type uncharacterized transport system involved in gliding motility auxiliary subunit
MAGEQKGKAKAPAKKAVVKKPVKKTKAPEAKAPEASATPPPAPAPPPEPKKFKNRALEVSGELHIMVHAQSGVDSKESYCQSQIVIDFENGDVMKNAAETVLLPPERTRLLLKILGLDSLDFMKKHYGKEA